jgi:hypothetical protein
MLPMAVGECFERGNFGANGSYAYDKHWVNIDRDRAKVLFFAMFYLWQPFWIEQICQN